MAAIPGAVAYWVPDRQPVWIDILMIVLVTLSFTLTLSEVGLRWEWFVVGFILCLLGIGPVAQTTYGKTIGSLFRAIGQRGRAIVIVLFAIVLWGALFSVPVIRGPTFSFGFGMTVALGMAVAVAIVALGPPDDWTRA